MRNIQESFWRRVTTAGEYCKSIIFSVQTVYLNPIIFWNFYNSPVGLNSEVIKLGLANWSFDMEHKEARRSGSNAKVSDGSQPPVTFDLSLSETAGSRPLYSDRNASASSGYESGLLGMPADKVSGKILLNPA